MLIPTALSYPIGISFTIRDIIVVINIIMFQWQDFANIKEKKAKERLYRGTVHPGGCIHMNVRGEKNHVSSPTWTFCIHIKSTEPTLSKKPHFTYERENCVFIFFKFTLLREF